MANLKFRSRDKDKISRNEILINKPTHMKFNLSFVTANRRFCFENSDFSDEHKLNFLNRLYFLSKEDFVRTFNYPKNIGLELINRSSIRRPLEYSPRFEDAEFRKKEGDSKYAVFRIYPNNNPLPARVIGKIINNVFYIMFIDLNHENVQWVTCGSGESFAAVFL